MKKVLLMLTLLLSLSVNAMKIETDEIDEFTGKRTLITSWEGICKNKIHIRFRLQNDKEFLDFKYSPDRSIVISDDDYLMFKSIEGSIARFKPIDYLQAEEAKGQ